MPNNSLSSIRAALLATLQGVTRLQAVYTGRVVNISGFPACRFYLTDVSEEIEDNKVSYWRTYRFGIEVIQEAKNKDETSAEQDFEDAVQGVLDALDANPYLTNASVKNCDLMQADAGKVLYGNTWAGPALVCTLTLTVKTFVG